MARSWKVRLTAARKRGSFTPNDRRAASVWRSCAVSELAPNVDMLDFALRPSRLVTLGVDFTISVDENDVHKAAAAYKAIGEYVKAEGL